MMVMCDGGDVCAGAGGGVLWGGDRGGDDAGGDKDGGGCSPQREVQCCQVPHKDHHSYRTRVSAIFTHRLVVNEL